MQEPLDVRLAETYGALSATLRQAADYVIENPVAATSRSLRAVAQESGLSPAAFSRMARAVGYESFEALREEMRESLDRRMNRFSKRAELLCETHARGAGHFLETYTESCTANIRALGETLDPARLEAAVEALHEARRVVLVGALGSTGVVEHVAYMANFLSADWTLAARAGSSMGAALAGLGAGDAMLVVTKPPCATSSLRAAALAREQGAAVVVVTDTHACPALPHATHAFIVPGQSTNFFTSYTPTLFLLETIMGLVARRGGAEARRRIGEVEARNRRLDEVQDG